MQHYVTGVRFKKSKYMKKIYITALMFCTFFLLDCIKKSIYNTFVIIVYCFAFFKYSVELTAERMYLMRVKILKSTALILVAAVSFMVVKFSVLGTQDVPESAYTYSLDGNNATITGCNADLSGAVMLPATIDGYTVVGIGEKAFKDFSEVTCFFMPSTITSIGSYAFEGCTSLLNASFPDALESIGDGAYWDCSSLVSVTIPSFVTHIGTCAFYGCDDLESLVVLSSDVHVSGIFDVQLDIGEVVAFGAGVLTIPGDPSVPDVYCFSDSLAYDDLLTCQFSNYVLLDDDSTTITSYVVRYFSDTGATLYPNKAFPVQPSGIDVVEVAAYIDGYVPNMGFVRTTLSSTETTITFVYETAPETTTEEPTTTTTTTTTEPSTETSTETTTEPTTETTTETNTEPEPDPVLVARANSGCIIDESKGYIYGITPGPDGLSEQYISMTFLGVSGGGYVRYIYSGAVGTNTTVQLVRSSDDAVLKSYSLIIFGDIFADGLILQSDLILLKSYITGSSTIVEGTPAYFAADLNGDNLLTQTDYTILKSVISGANTINQSTGRID